MIKKDHQSFDGPFYFLRGTSCYVNFMFRNLINNSKQQIKFNKQINLRAYLSAAHKIPLLNSLINVESLNVSSECPNVVPKMRALPY